MTYSLLPYQSEGAEWLSRNRQALLADEMGLGKSAQAIRACDLVDAENILIVCPAAMRTNWSREFVRFSNKSRIITEIKTGKHESDHGVNIISYDLLAMNEGLRRRLIEREWDALIIDEAHYCKERKAKRTKSVYGYGRAQGLSDRARYVWRLTGTPIMNFSNELYTHLTSMGAIDMAYWDFVFRYCTGFEGDYGYRITGHKNVEELKAIIDPYMLRRKKADVMKELPPITYHEVTVAASKVPLAILNRDETKTVSIADMTSLDAGLRQRLLSVMNRTTATNDDLLDVLEANNAAMTTLRRWIGLAKLERALEIIYEDLSTNAVPKIVIFGIHTQVIELAEKALRAFNPVILYGSTRADKRQEAIDSFQNDPSVRVFIGNIVAAGVGITLTAANEIAFLESDWTPANNSQAAMRCHRIGQKNPVRVRIFTCADSVDELVTRVLTIKSREQGKIFD